MARTSTPKPHPLTPSPRRGEGERTEKSSRSSPLSTLGRGGQGVRTAFTRKLLAWWARAARDLPWRKTRDPYRVLVSEFMLQQTQVSRVAEYYPRFLERFPDLETLARARPRAVREAWDGLGYYARARNLHSLAKQVAGRGEAGRGVTGRGVAGRGVAGRGVAGRGVAGDGVPT